MNELNDHLIKLIESDDERYSFKWAVGNVMEIFDKENKIDYMLRIAPIEQNVTDNSSDSLLKLLKIEDSLVREIKAYNECKELFADRIEQNEKQLLNCRRKIAEHLDYIKSL